MVAETEGLTTSRKEDASPPVPGPRATVPLLLLILTAIVWRVTVFQGTVHIGHSDQINYLHVAQGLLGGEVLDPAYPAGFPLLIAGALRIGISPERAGQAVCLVLGSMLLVVCYFLSATVLGRRAALVGTFIMAIHPELVRRSTDGQSEASFMFFVYSALLCVVLALKQTTGARRRMLAVCSGIFFGWAYVARPEGLVYGLAAVGMVVAIGMRASPVKKGVIEVGVAALVPLVAIVLMFMVTVVRPQTGHWRLSTKPLENIRTYDEDLATGEAMRFSVAALEKGKWAVDYTAGRGTRGAYPAGAAMLKLLAKNYNRAYREVLPSVLDYVLVLLCAFGLYSLRRVGGGAGLDQMLLLSPSIIAIAMPAISLQPRYYTPIIPCVVLWAGAGVAACTSLKARQWYRSAPLLLLLLLFLIYLKPNYDLYGDRASGREEIVAGSWLADNTSQDAILMERKSTVGFYAHRKSMTIPYAGLPQIFDYAKRHHVDYLILSEQFIGMRPQLSDLLRSKSSYRGLELVYDTAKRSGGAGGDGIRIYRLTESQAGTEGAVPLPAAPGPTTPP